MFSFVDPKIQEMYLKARSRPFWLDNDENLVFKPKAVEIADDLYFGEWDESQGIPHGYGFWLGKSYLFEGFSNKGFKHGCCLELGFEGNNAYTYFGKFEKGVR